MTILDRIRTTLEMLAQDPDEPMTGGVHYGACRSSYLDRWDYFVFNRAKTVKASNRCDLNTRYQVHIIHEDFIPEGYVQRVIDALEAQSEPGTKLKSTDTDITYDYVFKQNTDMVCEVATIEFVHPEKRG